MQPGAGIVEILQKCGPKITNSKSQSLELLCEGFKMAAESVIVWAFDSPVATNRAKVYLSLNDFYAWAAQRENSKGIITVTGTATFFNQ